MISDALYPSRKGTCDSEAIFLAALSRGLESDPVAAFRDTLSEIEAMRGAVSDEPVRFAAVHSDGERLFAFRWASDDKPPSLYARSEGRAFSSPPSPAGGTRRAGAPFRPAACWKRTGRDACSCVPSMSMPPSRRDPGRLSGLG